MANQAVYEDRIPLLEEVAGYKGYPGGIPGLEYAYVSLDDIYDWTSWDPEPPKDYRGSKPEMWKWGFPRLDGDSSVLRVVDTKTKKTCDFQILVRGEPLDGAGPGWYRNKVYVNSILNKLGWSGNREREALGLQPETTNEEQLSGTR